MTDSWAGGALALPLFSCVLPSCATGNTFSTSAAGPEVLAAPWFPSGPPPGSPASILHPRTWRTRVRRCPTPARISRQALPKSLPFVDRSFDAALALLVLQDFTEPRQAISEMAKVTRRGGIVTACQWDFEDGLPMLSLLWQAAEAVAPEAVAKQRRENPRSRSATLGELDALWRSCALSDIRTATLELPMHYSSFNDYWQPFLGGSTPTSAFAAAVNARTGGALARVLRDRLTGVQPDGSFVLPARAWAIKGTARQ